MMFKKRLANIKGRTTSKSSLASKNNLIAIVLGVLIGLSIFVALLEVAHHASWRSAAAQTFSRQPEPFAELYFVDHQHLPRDLMYGQQYTAKFAIVNHEPQSQNYRYRLIVTEGQHQLLDQIQSVEIRSSQITVPTISFTPKSSDLPIVVRVELISKNLTIQYRARP